MAEIVSVKRAGEVVFDDRGNVLCDHGKIHYYCRDCNGLAFCKHGKKKFYCIDCGGAQICSHGIRKERCRECGGSAYCEHGIQKQRCRECGGSQICVHNKQKSTCRLCHGSSYCKKHGKIKSLCRECGGSQLCKSPWCETKKRKKFDDHCLRCFIHLYPDVKISRNYKTKESDVVSRITESFPNFTWVTDKKVQDGCSRRRPDLLLDLGSHIIIIEVDENRHTDYDCSCEHKRLMQLSQDVGHRSIVFIRFNPDEYVKNFKKITSCWKTNIKTGLLYVPVSKTEEWSKRIGILKETINYWVSNPTEKTIEIIELFY
jgi:hypothetical protein